MERAVGTTRGYLGYLGIANHPVNVTLAVPLLAGDVCLGTALIVLHLSLYCCSSRLQLVVRVVHHVLAMLQHSMGVRGDSVGCSGPGTLQAEVGISHHLLQTCSRVARSAAGWSKLCIAVDGCERVTHSSHHGQRCSASKHAWSHCRAGVGGVCLGRRGPHMPAMSI